MAIVPCSAARGFEPDQPPAGAASQPAESAATPRVSGDPEVDAVLDRLEEKDKVIDGLESKLTYRYVTVDPVENTTTKTGTLLFKKAPAGATNSMFRIDFDTYVADGVQSKHQEVFAFDGRWLTELNGKAKTVVRREIVRPGESTNPFRMGKGPFPLPFGQKREDILANFTVTREKFAATDPPRSIHLHCVPRARTEMSDRYSRVEIYVDRTLDLPVRIVSERKLDGNRIEVDFTAIDTKAAPAGSRFRVEIPSGFEERTEPLSEGDKIRSIGDQDHP